MTNDTRATFITRDTILKMLSDDEVARVSMVETESRLPDGDEYLDLTRLDRGVQRAEGTSTPTSNLLARNSVHDDTWTRILARLARPLSAVFALVLLSGNLLLAQKPAITPINVELKPGEIIMIGCLQSEADYRAINKQGAGGVLGTSIGASDEYVLVGATPVRAAGGAATKAGPARDFSLTGKLEKGLAREAGRMVEVVGSLNEEEGRLPRITVSLAHPVGDFCPAAQKR